MKSRVFTLTLAAATLLCAGAFRLPSVSAATPQDRRDVREASSAKTQKSPQQVLQEFCELDLHGKQLTLEGREEVAAFFLKAEMPPQSKIWIVLDCVVSEPAMSGTKADFYVEQLMLGQLDSSFRYIPANPDYPDDLVMIRRDQALLLTQEHWKLGPTGVAIQKITGPLAWRLDSDYQPAINVSTAINYVTRVRDTTSDQSIRNNATKTLAVLALIKKVGNPYAKRRSSLSDSERQQLYALFPKQNPCPEIGSMDALKDSAEITARKIASAVEAQDAASVLALASTHGAEVTQRGDPPYSDLASEFSNKTDAYCRLFDTSCLEQPVPSPIAPWLPKRTYSYREWLTRSRPYEMKIDLVKANVCDAQIVLVPSGQSTVEYLPKYLYLQLTFESDDWRLLSIGYGETIP
jgi:hypothetical protein